MTFFGRVQMAKRKTKETTSPPSDGRADIGSLLNVLDSSGVSLAPAVGAARLETIDEALFAGESNEIVRDTAKHLRTLHPTKLTYDSALQVMALVMTDTPLYEPDDVYEGSYDFSDMGVRVSPTMLEFALEYMKTQCVSL